MATDKRQSLQSLGLSEREAAVYAALLQMKKGTASTIARAAGIKRPTAYGVLTSLCKKKLVAITKFRDVRDYRALPLEHLKSFVRKQKKSALAFVPAMKQRYDARQFKTRLRIYRGTDAVKILLEKSLRESAALFLIGNEETFRQYIGDYWQFYLKRAHQRRMAPFFKSCPSQITLMLWSDKVSFVEFGETPQVFAFKNRALHDMYQTLWNTH